MMETFHWTLTLSMEFKKLKLLMNGSKPTEKLVHSLLKDHLSQVWANMVLDGLVITSLKRSI